jgi:hypothetical protein
LLALEPVCGKRRKAHTYFVGPLRVGRAGFDWRIFLQAFLKLSEDFEHGFGDASDIRSHVALFLQVGEDIDQLRQRESPLWFVRV